MIEQNEGDKKGTLIHEEIRTMDKKKLNKIIDRELKRLKKKRNKVK